MLKKKKRKMISKFIEFIKESPDICYYFDDELCYMTVGAHPFGTLNGKTMVGEEKETHYDLARPKSRDDLTNAGRLWSENNIISFWNLDQQTTLEIVIKELNKAIIKKDYYFIIDDKWEIEVFNRYDKTVEFYNLFDFMKLAPYGYNNRYSAIFDEHENNNNYIDRNVNINIRDFLSSYRVNDNKNNK
ncbi:hypothetical protein M0Q97_01960 [Candidatus Dojkabacteria bacterium]|nr:hypothetical protein [Candidatus Dojkabacteria bacterium]